jgi:hypothetical protein
VFFCGNKANSTQLVCEWAGDIIARHSSEANTDPAPDRHANKKKENLQPMLGGLPRCISELGEMGSYRSLWKKAPPRGQILSGVCFKSWLSTGFLGDCCVRPECVVLSPVFADGNSCTLTSHYLLALAYYGAACAFLGVILQTPNTAVQN